VRGGRLLVEVWGWSYVIDGRLKRRLRRRRLSEEANHIKWEDRREVKHLRAEVGTT
jgi:hypothetical protein